MIALDLIS